MSDTFALENRAQQSPLILNIARWCIECNGGSLPEIRPVEAFKPSEEVAAAFYRNVGYNELLRLPAELRLCIYDCLGGEELLTLRRVCRAL